MMFMDKPLFIWFGIMAGILLIATVVSGLARAKLKIHKMLAFTTVAFLALHVLGVLGVY